MTGEKQKMYEHTLAMSLVSLSSPLYTVPEHAPSLHFTEPTCTWKQTHSHASQTVFLWMLHVSWKRLKFK